MLNFSNDWLDLIEQEQELTKEISNAIANLIGSTVKNVDDLQKTVSLTAGQVAANLGYDVLYYKIDLSMEFEIYDSKLRTLIIKNVFINEIN